MGTDTVCVRLTVGKDGTPHNLQVASPQDARLDKEAIAIVGEWRFRPGMQKTQPVEVPATFTLVTGLGQPHDGEQSPPAIAVAPIVCSGKCSWRYQAADSSIGKRVEGITTTRGSAHRIVAY